MRILAIETSCDETAIAIADFERAPLLARKERRARVKILSHIVSSQTKLHAAYGGVVPNLARREHEKNLVPLLAAASRFIGTRRRNHKSQTPNHKQGTGHKSQNIEKALAREPELLRQFKKHVASLPPPDIDAIAVTYGPGLAPALWTGVNFARALAILWDKPLIPVNHMAGHFFSALLKKAAHSRLSLNATRLSLECAGFPILALLVSGGHTELVLVKRPWQFRIIGETLDDAAGEAFDKVGRILGLPYPGGPEISRLAISGDPKKYSLPSPMINTKDYNFSFSGLKTATLYLIRDRVPNLVRYKKADIAASFEKAVVDVLVKKTVRAAKEYKVKIILLGGGVAANLALRAALDAALKRESPSSKFQVPLLDLCGDNALMIAAAAYFCGKKKPATEVRAYANARLG